MAPAAALDNFSRDLEREIAATDAQIDALVYELYGITAEERRIIDESTGANQV